MKMKIIFFFLFLREKEEKRKKKKTKKEEIETRKNQKGNKKQNCLFWFLTLLEFTINFLPDQFFIISTEQDAGGG